MKSRSSVLLLGLAFALVGCSVRVENPPHPRHYPPAHKHPAPTGSDFDARIAAAGSISSFTRRDAALSVIAVDAADEGDVYHASKALSMISSFTKRDSTAERCADIFLEYRMHAAAGKMADHVSSFTTRDRILSKIAQTPAADSPE